MAVTLPAAALSPFGRFSLYNSPYPAHDRGCGIDLYPPGAHTPAGSGEHAAGSAAPTGDGDVASPVAGEVVLCRTVSAPSRPYAAPRDHLILVDTGAYLARILHVDPAVDAGDRIAVGEPLGRLVRSGYFAPWVGNHLHLEFRPPEADPLRATGSVAIDPGVDVAGVPWDGTGRVIAAGDTYAILDTPAHPAPGERFAAVAADGGAPLDGGLVHYSGGGALDRLGRGESRAPNPSGATSPESVALLGREIGVADGRDIAWTDVVVRANGERVTGLSLSAGRETLRTKLVGRGLAFAPGDRVRVTLTS